MGDNNNKIVLASGRFDRPHIGHIISLMRLGQRYKRVIIPVLDYREQQYSVQYRAQILREALSMAKGDYEVVVNDENFERISPEAVKQFKFDVYASQNEVCLKHMESLGYEVVYFDRSYDFSATDDRMIQNIKRVLPL